MSDIKRFIMLLAIMLFFNMFSDATEYITVKSQDTPISIALSEKPKITFENNLMIITTSERTLELPLDNALNCFFTNTSTQIVDVMRNVSGAAYFEKLEPGSTIQIINSKGVEIMRSNADMNGNYLIDLNGIPKGIYILKSNKYSIKILNK